MVAGHESANRTNHAKRLRQARTLNSNRIVIVILYRLLSLLLRSNLLESLAEHYPAISTPDFPIQCLERGAEGPSGSWLSSGYRPWAEIWVVSPRSNGYPHNPVVSRCLTMGVLFAVCEFYIYICAGGFEPQRRPRVGSIGCSLSPTRAYTGSSIQRIALMPFCHLPLKQRLISH